jgi:hypothetical protein
VKKAKAMKQKRLPRRPRTAATASRDQISSMATSGEGIERVIALAAIVLANVLDDIKCAIKYRV